jgi:hypothetical protein
MIMNKILRALIALFVLGLSSAAYAQQTVNTTTLTTALTNATTSKTVVLGSVSNIVAGSGLFMDSEAMSVVSVNSTAKTVQVIRGVDGTKVASHAANITVYSGPTSGITGSGPFWNSDPAFGTCTLSSEQYSLHINVQNGRVWACTASTWLNSTDSFVWFPSTACNSSVSGNSTGTNGYTVLGTAPSIPVVQASTSASGTNTHYYTCTITPPSRINVSKSAYVVDVQFLYGVQTTGLGTQVAVLSSGTMNAKTVFQYINYPASAASETAAGLAEATRADAGSLTITPVVGSFNVGTTTAGEFYSALFIPATPIAVATDLRQLLFTVSLLNTATSGTITNSPGFFVHYRTLSAGF